jgi:tRNA uridine 5-carboxymethylaminomethyl modification enzyme
MKKTKIKITEEIKEKFIQNNLSVPTTTLSLEQLLKRPEITIDFLNKIAEIPYEEDIQKQIEIEYKYEGYIKKQIAEAEKLIKLEKKQIPDDIDYDKIKNIASEARQKLKEVRPKTIAQAIRISGVNPADISILSVYLKKEYNQNE